MLAAGGPGGPVAFGAVAEGVAAGVPGAYWHASAANTTPADWTAGAYGGWGASMGVPSGYGGGAPQSNAAYYYDASASAAAAAAGPFMGGGHDSTAASTYHIAKRKCGRPKAPNPLDDPTIPEKKARR